MKQQKQTSQREAGMMTCTGFQGVGKTYQNMHIIKEYVKDKFYNGVSGRKCLIFDTNGEYTKEQFERNDISDFEVKRIALKDIHEWSRSSIIECRRVDAKNLSIKDKKKCLEYILKVYRNGLMVIEDINTYILSVTHMEEIVGHIVNLRHRAADVLISYQSLRPVEPRIWQNSRWVRFHYQADNVNDIKAKVTNIVLFKIAQNIVNNRYFSGDKRFFLYVMVAQNKLEGKFTKKEFVDACRQFAMSNKKYVKEYKEMNDCSQDEAYEGLVKQYYEQYFGNKK
jgi:hypothetical protein